MRIKTLAVIVLVVVLAGGIVYATTGRSQAATPTLTEAQARQYAEKAINDCTATPPETRTQYLKLLRGQAKYANGASVVAVTSDGAWVFQVPFDPKYPDNPNGQIELLRVYDNGVTVGTWAMCEGR